MQTNFSSLPGTIANVLGLCPDIYGSFLVDLDPSHDGISVFVEQICTKYTSSIVAGKLLRAKK